VLEYSVVLTTSPLPPLPPPSIGGTGRLWLAKTGSKNMLRIIVHCVWLYEYMDYLPEIMNNNGALL
jgi:hypothetical protein